MAGANFGDRPLTRRAEEHGNLRSAAILSFESFDEDIMDRAGVASGLEGTLPVWRRTMSGDDY